MTDVTFRKMRFDIDESVPFQWHPANPAAGMMANAISFIAVGFERYIVLAVKEALQSRITDPELRAEAEVFLAQESQHSAAHRRHVKALTARYPGLADVLDRVIASYETLFSAEDLNFHLAYVANIEASFPPIFGFFIERRDCLYSGDNRVASLFLWHYIEEIEHRSSADIIFEGVVGSRRYRLSTVRRTWRHLMEVLDIVIAGFTEHVPSGDIGISPQAFRTVIFRNEAIYRIPMLRRRFPPQEQQLLAGVSTPRLVRMFGGIALSQLPGRRPADAPVPDWYYTWMRSYAAGEDMAHYYGTACAG
ncbi:metal-dependent hydrolase [Mycobacterium sp. M26]|uniref:metal-dependent hydrolase n=1 Tax=Mycobacterium sp. M26 TaxID=1762962 RepID=UPI00073F0970|nr:metal-dependent hydrolase [Mycobacterium sp. M26]